MTECNLDLPYDFHSPRSLVVRFSELEMSSDAGILLARQAEERVRVCQGIAECIKEWREPHKIIHSLNQLISQRVYQLVGGYEDANDSNHLRHDPIYKIACGRLPIAQGELLASQPTITRLENHVSKREVAAMRTRMVQGFIDRYEVAPEEIVLDIDGWDDPTHGQQQLSCFHGYFGQHMYFPVLINEAICVMHPKNWTSKKPVLVKTTHFHNHTSNCCFANLFYLLLLLFIPLTLKLHWC